LHRQHDGEVDGDVALDGAHDDVDVCRLAVEDGEVVEVVEREDGTKPPGPPPP
jgi:hypothetical protein